MNSLSVVDYAEALHRAAEDELFLKELFYDMLEFFPMQLEKLDNAVQQGAAKNVSAIAHTIKGAALNLSVKSLAGAAFNIEQLGTNYSLDDYNAARELLVEEFAKFKDYVQQESWKQQ